MREQARLIFQAAIRAADGGKKVKRFLKKERNLVGVGREVFRLHAQGRLLVVGAGKATATMARSVEEILDDALAGGVIVVKYGHALPLKRIEVVEAGHPLPDRNGLEGARKIFDLVKGAGQNDLLLCLFSGGASALLPLPVSGVTLTDKQEVTRLLLNCGAAIQEINTVRKHLSRIKGGGLARTAHPARVVSLIVSDCVGDPLDVVASGPTAPDPSSFKGCLDILARYELMERVPASVLSHFKAGVQGLVPETPKPGDAIFKNVTNLIVANNRLALKAAATKAARLGWQPLILSSFITGDTRQAAIFHAAVIKEIRASGHPVRPPACLLSGGETTVVVTGPGMGGRNQEFALTLAKEIRDMEGVLALIAGSDGTDGPTDAAGAFADGTTLRRGESLGMEAASFLAQNDSYNYFRVLGDLFFTGPTGTNVMDIRIILLT